MQAYFNISPRQAIQKSESIKNQNRILVIRKRVFEVKGYRWNLCETLFGVSEFHSRFGFT